MIIGITGQARVGKDTFAEILAEELFNESQQKFIMMAYAHELKLRVQKDFDLSYEQLWGDEKEIPDTRYERHFFTTLTGGIENIETKPVYWTPREILQFIGTECFRSVDNNFWTKALFRKIAEKEYKNVIITDVRFPNEAEPITKSGGYVVKISRDSKQEIHGDSHISETAMNCYENVDFNVNNSGTLDDLRVVAKQAIQFFIETEKLNKGGSHYGKEK